MKLIIFDMDQTLVDFMSFHDEAVNRLFQRFFGIQARLTEIDFAGRSLSENFVELARLRNIPEGRLTENAKQLIEAYERIFAEIIPEDASRYILPGVTRLLEELSRTDHLVVLYTGDSVGIIETVLEATDLGKYFRFFLSGTEVDARTDMVRLAIEKAERLTGKEFRGKDIVIIGDSVRDIACAREFGAVAIAVATGFRSEAELSRDRPDYLLKTLEDHSKVLEAIR